MKGSPHLECVEHSAMVVEMRLLSSSVDRLSVRMERRTGAILKLLIGLVLAVSGSAAAQVFYL